MTLLYIYMYIVTWAHVTYLAIPHMVVSYCVDVMCRTLQHWWTVGYYWNVLTFWVVGEGGRGRGREREGKGEREVEGRRERQRERGRKRERFWQAPLSFSFSSRVLIHTEEETYSWSHVVWNGVKLASGGVFNRFREVDAVVGLWQAGMTGMTGMQQLVKPDTETMAQWGGALKLTPAPHALC